MAESEKEKEEKNDDENNEEVKKIQSKKKVNLSDLNSLKLIRKIWKK